MIATNPTPSARDYQEYSRQLQNVEKQSLTDRKAARAEWLDALRNSPETIKERVEWLIDGNYGYVSYYNVRATIQNKRMNRTAYLGQLIAALEWQCPNAYAREAWNHLTATQQESITAMLNEVIESALADMQAESE